MCRPMAAVSILLFLLRAVCVVQGAITLTPFDGIAAHAPRLRNASFTADAVNIDTAWAAAQFEGKKALEPTFARMMGLIDNEWIDPAKLDGAIHDVLSALIAANSTNGIDTLKAAIIQLEKDFVQALQTQSVAYTPSLMPAIPTMTSILPQETAEPTATVSPSNADAPPSLDPAGAGTSGSDGKTRVLRMDELVTAFGLAVLVSVMASI
ncbi:hypothetical protein DFJ77DRAFT_343853 [Powellomyces hirtus]|nr:hypothetical protein DFJ77DRAFT_343853 [Powellomyces hirtus]